MEKERSSVTQKSKICPEDVMVATLTTLGGIGLFAPLVLYSYYLLCPPVETQLHFPIPMIAPIDKSTNTPTPIITDIITK